MAKTGNTQQSNTAEQKTATVDNPKNNKANLTVKSVILNDGTFTPDNQPASTTLDFSEQVIAKLPAEQKTIMNQRLVVFNKLAEFLYGAEDSAVGARLAKTLQSVIKFNNPEAFTVIITADYSLRYQNGFILRRMATCIAIDNLRNELQAEGEGKHQVVDLRENQPEKSKAGRKAAELVSVTL